MMFNNPKRSEDRILFNRRHLIGAAISGAAAAGLALAPDAKAQTVLFAGDELNQPGPEAQMLMHRVGLWDVVETVWATPGASPTVSRGLVAERVMVGTALQEVHPSASRHRTPRYQANRFPLL